MIIPWGIIHSINTPGCQATCDIIVYVYKCAKMIILSHFAPAIDIVLYDLASSTIRDS